MYKLRVESHFPSPSQFHSGIISFRGWRTWLFLGSCNGEVKGGEIAPFSLMSQRLASRPNPRVLPSGHFYSHVVCKSQATHKWNQSALHGTDPAWLCKSNLKAAHSAPALISLTGSLEKPSHPQPLTMCCPLPTPNWNSLPFPCTGFGDFPSQETRPVEFHKTWSSSEKKVMRGREGFFGRGLWELGGHPEMLPHRYGPAKLMQEAKRTISFLFSSPLLLPVSTQKSLNPKKRLSQNQK